VFEIHVILAKLESSSDENIQHDVLDGIKNLIIKTTVTLLTDKKYWMLKRNELEKEVLDHRMTQAFITIHCLKSDASNIMLKLKEIQKL
jgi:hypothetical protein